MFIVVVVVSNVDVVTTIIIYGFSNIIDDKHYDEVKIYMCRSKPICAKSRKKEDPFSKTSKVAGINHTPTVWTQRSQEFLRQQDWGKIFPQFKKRGRDNNNKGL